jgi:hypothetical protein
MTFPAGEAASAPQPAATTAVTIPHNAFGLDRQVKEFELGAFTPHPCSDAAVKSGSVVIGSTKYGRLAGATSWKKYRIVHAGDIDHQLALDLDQPGKRGDSEEQHKHEDQQRQREEGRRVHTSRIHPLTIRGTVGFDARLERRRAWRAARPMRIAG